MFRRKYVDEKDTIGYLAMNFEIRWKKYEACVEPMLFNDIYFAIYEVERGEWFSDRPDLVEPKKKIFREEHKDMQKMFDICCDYVQEFIMREV